MLLGVIRRIGVRHIAAQDRYLGAVPAAEHEVEERIRGLGRFGAALRVLREVGRHRP